MFETSFIRAQNNNQIYMVIKLDGRKILTGGLRMLMRDLFSVANLLVCIAIYEQIKID